MTYETQATKLLKHLKENRGLNVTLTSCVRAMGGYRVSARVKELRDKGYTILITPLYRGRKHFSYYKLVDNAKA